MGNKIIWTPDRTVNALYFTVQDADGAYYNGATFEAETPANWATYAVAMTAPPATGRSYIGTFPAVAAGVYSVVVYVRSGSTAAKTDAIEARDTAAYWDGSDLRPATSPSDMVILVPVTSTGNSGLIDETSLTAYRNASFSFIRSIIDANGDPVDLSDKSLVFLAYPPGKTTSIEIELTTEGEAGDRITVGGDNDNQVTIEGSDTHTASPRVLRWCLRDQDDDVVLLRGPFTIADEADQAEEPPPP